MKNSNKKAFTLVELLVVIAIIGILFVVLISKVDFATDKSKATGVQTDFRSFQLAVETVARENAGLASLVKSTDSGDTNGNGVIDAGETSGTVTYDYEALEAALNKNLDPKLHVKIDDDGKISTKAQDPWKEEYTGEYIKAVDGEHRGAIVFYCGGANLEKELEAVVTDGEVVVTYDDDDAAEDSYSVATIYTFKNGYGEIISTSTGFSNNQ